jgi:hypothetical protein
MAENKTFLELHKKIKLFSNFTIEIRTNSCVEHVNEEVPNVDEVIIL